MKSKINCYDKRINNLYNENLQLNNLYFNNSKLYNYINEKSNWIKLFGIYNTKDYLIFYLFGFKITLKINEKNINKLAWWTPIKKWRMRFRNKFKSIN